ncbi:MAG: SH3 domain-containing protein [Chloroflexi bacterium]|nr:SH3 domain-containing protein [Chloroflexota bacterium]
MPINKKILFLLPLLALACSITPAASLAAMVTPSPSPSPPPSTPSPTATPQDVTCTVTAESLHLRAMPGTDAQVIGYLYAGETLTVLPDPSVDSWIRVRAGDLTGWINSHYCTKGQ